MKKKVLLILLAVMPLLAGAQPSWVKKATKSVFTLKTFAADGSLIGSSNGFLPAPMATQSVTTPHSRVPQEL